MYSAAVSPLIIPAFIITAIIDPQDASDELHFTDSASTDLPHMPLGSGTPTDEEPGPLSAGDEPRGGNLLHDQANAAPSAAAEDSVSEQQPALTETPDVLQIEDNTQAMPHLVTFKVTVTLAVPAGTSFTLIQSKHPNLL